MNDVEMISTDEIINEAEISSEEEIITNRNAEVISTIAFLLAVATAIFLRFYLLEIKPLHHDEGVNSHFLLNLANSGNYKYDPTNYHGPTLYYFSWLTLKLLGESVFALRFYPAICGVLTVILMWGLRRGLGLVGTPVAAWSLALSPGLVYYSRDFIHESSFGFFTVGIIVCAYNLRDSYLWFLPVFAGLLFATKETAIHTVGVLVAAVICALVWDRLRRYLTGDDRESSWFGWVREYRVTWQYWLYFFAVFVAINILFYSSFFTNWKGVLDAFRSVFMWTGRGFNEHIHDHVFTYYLGILVKLELPLLVTAIIGIPITLWRGTKFGLFHMAWTCGMVLGYSRIPYKTPWLMVSMLIALAVFSGYVAQEIFSLLRMTPLQIAFVVLLVAVAVPTAMMCWQVNQHKYEDNENTAGYFAEFGKKRNLTAYTDTQYGYVYAQTDDDLLNLVREVERIKPDAIYYSTPDYWPLPWYFRDQQISGYGDKLPEQFTGDVLIAADDQREEAEQKFQGKYRAQQFTLRPGVNLVLFVKEEKAR
ncbi:MAG TPA: flippase activity-associated protein Agl23 [Blastocatellia bacterium]|nr:flippase activity-associated protein Agl23 [Blastocatellia bacterium]